MRKITFWFFFLLLLPFGAIAQEPGLPLEGFEGAWPPAGWIITDNGIGGPSNVWQQATNSGPTPSYEGNHAAYIGRQNTSGIAEDWLITPAFVAPSSAQLQFYSRLTIGGNDGGIYRIYMFTGNGDPADITGTGWVEIQEWTELQLNPLQTQYTQKVVPLTTAVPGSTIRLAFVMAADDADRWLVDNVQVVQQCLDPAGVEVNGVTTTSATIDWDNPNNVTSWQLEIIPAASAPTGVGFAYNGAPPYVIPAGTLTQDTAYKVYVRANCSPTNISEWSDPVNFSTVGLGDNCANAIQVSTLPYITTDNTANYADTFHEGSPGASGCGSTSAYLDGNDVVYEYTASITGNININVSGNGAWTGVFVYNDCANVGVLCAGGAVSGGSATPIDIPTFPVVAGEDYFIVISTWPAPQTTAYTLRIQQVFCTPPVGQATTGVTATSANLSWTNPGGAASWQVALQPAGTGFPTASTPTITAGTNTNFPVTGLTPATSYEYYVRALCPDASGNYSAWAGPYTFMTSQIPATMNYTQNFDTAGHGWSLANGTQTNKWVVGTAVSNSPTNSLYISNDNGVTNAYNNGTSSVVHAFRDIQMPATIDQVSLSFDWKSVGDTGDYLRVWLVPTSFVPTPGTAIAAATGRIQVGGNLTGNNAWTNSTTIVNVGGFANQIMRVVFEWRNDAFGGVNPPAAVDNINITQLPCPTPTALTLGALTESTAAISWTGPTTVTPTYDVYYTTTNTPPGATTTPNSNVSTVNTNLTGLTSSTTYYVWVRSNCGALQSPWVGPLSFTTAQIPVTVPYAQNFDTATPHGFTLSNGTQTNKWVVGSAVSNSPANSLYVSNDNGATNSYTFNATSVVHAYRDIIIPAGANAINVAFDWRNIGESIGATNYDYIRVWMVPVSFIPTPGTQIGTGTGRVQLSGDLLNASAWTNAIFETPVTAYQNTVRRLVFEWRNDFTAGTNPPGAVDNINITVVTCPRPTALTATGVTSTSAVLDWTQSGSATNWEVSVLPAGSAAPTPTTSGTPVSGDSAYTIPASAPLTPATAYQYYVRANCGATDGMSSWAGPFAFTTKPLNDDCAQAIVAPVNPGQECVATVPGTVRGATASTDGGTTCTGTEDDDVWYEFTATSTAHLISLNNVTGSTTDLVHAVYSGNQCGTMALLYCSDDNNSFAANLVIGQVYKVRVFTWTSTTGQTSAFDLCISTAPPPPANDNCAGAVTVPVNPTLVCEDTVPGTVYAASASPENNTCGGTDDDDVWYQFTATSTAHVIQLRNVSGGSGFDTDLWHVVYTGDQCGTLTQLYCSDPNNSIATGLTIGQTYKIRVYSHSAVAGRTITFDVCVSTPTPTTSDDCADAIVVPVNQNASCELFASGSVWAATASPEPNTCGGTDDDDVWFEFTATHTSHLISLQNIVGANQALNHVVYSGDQCGSLTQLYCSTAVSSQANNLVVGNTYKVRVYTATATINQYTEFDICIRIPNTPIVVDQTTFTNQQLVTDVLIDSECATVSNIVTSTGSNFGDVNGIAYFNANGSDFPFEYGVVLSTTDALQADAPWIDFADGSNDAGDSYDWPGDDDLNDIVIANDPDQDSGMYNATFIEFDFIPLTNQFTFDFLLASNEYGTFQCSYSDAFAFILTHPDGTQENLAVIPNTDIPVAVTTIHDASNLSCDASNEQYFDQMNQNDPLASAINFNGQTVPLTATADVIPGETYRIKLVIADYSDPSFNSAVFLNGGSFDIGEIDLGGDLLVGENTALCAGETVTLDADLEGDNYIYTWYKDDELIDGANTSSYTVTESGEYRVAATFPNISCSFEGSVLIEVFPPVEDLTGEPVDLSICHASGFAAFDLTPNVNAILAVPADPENYTVTIHTSQEDAEGGLNPIADITAYTNTTAVQQTLYVRIVYNTNGCSAIKEFDLLVPDLTPHFTIDGDNTLCEGTSSTINIVAQDYDPALVTYTWTLDGDPIANTTGSITVTDPGLYQAVIDNTGCTATASFTVVVTPVPVADNPDDVTICDSYTLPVLSADNNYFTGPNGSGEMLSASDVITATQDIYVFAQAAANTDCTDENVFTVTIIQSPDVQPVANVDACDSYELPALAVGSYFTGPGGTGTELAATDVITTTQTLYVYAETGTTPNCTDEESFVVTVTPTPVADEPTDVVVCDSYRLPDLNAGNNYYTATGGQGTQIPAGTVLIDSQTIYVYAANGNCADEHMFEVTITPTPVLDEVPVVQGCDNGEYVLEVAFDENEEFYTPDNATFVWTNSAGTQVGDDSSRLVVTAPDTYTVAVYPASGSAECFAEGIAVVTETNCNIQRGISPDGDGDNDSFDLSTLNVLHLSIFNRYGQEVYSRSNYTDEWHGQTKDGNELPTGTYFYMIEQASGENTTGWIYINREQ